MVLTFMLKAYETKFTDGLMFWMTLISDLVIISARNGLTVPSAQNQQLISISYRNDNPRIQTI